MTSQSIQLFKIHLESRKRLVVELTKIFGIHLKYSYIICKKFGFNQNSRVQDMDLRILNEVRRFIMLTFLIQSHLSRSTQSAILELIVIKSIRGLRHKLNLPVRGQRTRTNHKTARSLTQQNYQF